MAQEQDDVKQLAEDLEANRTLSFKEFVAEMGVAGGGVAGIGIPNPNIPNQAEPGISTGRQKKYKKKNKGNSPAGMARRK